MQMFGGHCTGWCSASHPHGQLSCHVFWNVGSCRTRMDAEAHACWQHCLPFSVATWLSATCIVCIVCTEIVLHVSTDLWSFSCGMEKNQRVAGFFSANFRRSEVPLLGGSAFRMLRSCCSVGMTCHLVWVILYVLYDSKSPFFHHPFGRRCVGTFCHEKKRADPKLRPKSTFKWVTVSKAPFFCCGCFCNY